MFLPAGRPAPTPGVADVDAGLVGAPPVPIDTRVGLKAAELLHVTRYVTIAGAAWNSGDTMTLEKIILLALALVAVGLLATYGQDIFDTLVSESQNTGTIMDELKNKEKAGPLTGG